MKKNLWEWLPGYLSRLRTAATRTRHLGILGAIVSLVLAHGPTHAGNIHLPATVIAAEAITSEAQGIQSPLISYFFQGVIDASAHEQTFQVQWQLIEANSVGNADPAPIANSGTKWATASVSPGMVQLRDSTGYGYFQNATWVGVSVDGKTLFASFTVPRGTKTINSPVILFSPGAGRQASLVGLKSFLDTAVISQSQSLFVTVKHFAAVTQAAMLADGISNGVADEHVRSGAINTGALLIFRRMPTTLSIAAVDANRNEGISGGTPFTFAVMRSGSTAGTSSVNYTVSGGTANASDFVGGLFPSGKLDFAAGEIQKTITVNAAGDGVLEPNETFYVILSGASGATIATSTALGTIVNDDQGAPTGGDDYSSNINTAGRITVGSSITGSIDFSGDTDWFKVSLLAGVTYTFYLEGSASGGGTLQDPYIKGIYTNTGTLILGTSNDDSASNDANSKVTYTPTASADYHISAGAYGTATGTYKLSVTGGASTGNRAPIVSSPLPDQGWYVGRANSFQFSSNAFSDPDGNPLTYSASTPSGGSLPSWLSFDATTRTFSGSFPASTPSIAVRVTANDGYGGTVSDDFYIMPPAGTPGPEFSIVTATAGNALATVSFNLVSGASYYIVTASPGGLIAIGDASPITVAGLNNGTSYTFTVTAVSPSGAGSASFASNAVTPFSPLTAVSVPIAAGSSHTLALSSNGSLWAWGRNDVGQLGDGSTIDRSIPVQVDSGYIAVAAGGGWFIMEAESGHSLGLKTDGSLWGWGRNDYGQLGDGSTVNRLTPVQIGGGFSAVTAGQSHTAALKSDGSLWTWGNNYYGQLGDGSSVDSSAPLKIGDGYVAATAGRFHTLALKTDGSLWAWGFNARGQLGDGTATQRKTPVKIGDGFSAVAAGWFHSLAIKSDGSLLAWGDNRYGELGDGSSTQRNAPVLIGVGYRTAAAGITHTVALKTDGSLWSWGWNGYGQLGDTTTENRSAPVQIGSGYITLAAAVNHSMAMKGDGTLWTWGNNWNGQLGTGLFNVATAPQLVVNNTVTGFLDLIPDTPNYIPSTAIPLFLATAEKSGAYSALKLTANIYGLLGTPASSMAVDHSQRAVRNATSGYNVYVAALAGTSSMFNWYQLDANRNWGPITWPMAQFLSGIALNTSLDLVTIQVLDEVDVSSLTGSHIYVGYGTSADEMVTAGRYREILTISQ